MVDTKRKPWLFTLMHAQVSNAEAEKLGSSPWWLLVLVILASTTLSAFPLVNDRYKNLIASTNPANYPALSQVFKKIKTENWLLRVENGILLTESPVPAQVQVDKWMVVFEGSGGSSDLLMGTINGPKGDTTRGVVFFGKTHLGIVDQDTKSQFDGTWANLDGFKTADLSKVPLEKMMRIILYSSATGGVTQAYFSVLLLMFAQVVSLILIMGFLLSLSSVKIAGTSLGKSRRGAGFFASLKTAAGAALGPALIICIALFSLSGAGGISWVAFTLLYGARIVFIYMARFRNKKKKMKSTPVTE